MCGSISRRAREKKRPFRRRRNFLGDFFCDIFDMLNFFVAFLFEGTKFKLMRFFCPRMKEKASTVPKYRVIRGFHDSNGSRPCYRSRM